MEVDWQRVRLEFSSAIQGRTNDEKQEALREWIKIERFSGERWVEAVGSRNMGERKEKASNQLIFLASRTSKTF